MQWHNNLLNKLKIENLVQEKKATAPQFTVAITSKLYSWLKTSLQHCYIIPVNREQDSNQLCDCSITQILPFKPTGKRLYMLTHPEAMPMSLIWQLGFQQSTVSRSV